MENRNICKAYQVPYTNYTPKDIQKQQDDLVDEINKVLSLSKEDAAILLRHFRWKKDRLLDEYTDGGKWDQIVEAAGLSVHGGQPPQIQTRDGFCCEICLDDDKGLEFFALQCNHKYCVPCYRQYLTQKIREEGEVRIQCPSDGCRLIIDARSLNLLVPADLEARYRALLTRTYVQDKESLKWCPAADCENVVECTGIRKKDLERVVPTVVCICSHRFCFGCILNDHQPAPCELVKKWKKKCADDSETANWISANTKECPRCNSTIEKNGGCNHMTCRKCKHEFCWICMGLWSEHGTRRPSPVFHLSVICTTTTATPTTSTRPGWTRICRTRRRRR
jgi:ariadne-1